MPEQCGSRCENHRHYESCFYKRPLPKLKRFLRGRSVLTSKELCFICNDSKDQSVVILHQIQILCNSFKAILSRKSEIWSLLQIWKNSKICHGLGEVEKAIEYLSKSLVIFEEIKSPNANRVRKLLDELTSKKEGGGNSSNN